MTNGVGVGRFGLSWRWCDGFVGTRWCRDDNKHGRGVGWSLRSHGAFFEPIFFGEIAAKEQLLWFCRPFGETLGPEESFPDQGSCWRFGPHQWFS